MIQCSNPITSNCSGTAATAAKSNACNCGWRKSRSTLYLVPSELQHVEDTGVRTPPSTVLLV